jgi:hypothetical protein
MIISISAKKQHGKDTVASIIQELTNNKFKLVKFADKLKDFVCEIINCTRENLEDEVFKNTPLGEEWDFLDDNYNIQKMTPRLLLQKIGTEGLRNNVHENIWVNATLASYCEKCNWVISDMRFPNEVIGVKKLNGITIRVNRPSISNSDEHSSETSLDNYKEFDYIIENDSDLESLKEKVKNILIDLDIIQ